MARRTGADSLTGALDIDSEALADAEEVFTDAGIDGYVVVGSAVFGAEGDPDGGCAGTGTAAVPSDRLHGGWVVCGGGGGASMASKVVTAEGILRGSDGVLRRRRNGE